MEITEVRIKLMESSEDRLRGFCSITIDDCFVVRDLKIIDGASGPFVAMPSRKLAGHCQRCRHKNHLKARYCNHCGGDLNSAAKSFEPPQKLYADVAHPINSACRELIQNAVIEEFQAELALSRQPGYQSRYEDDFDVELGSGESASASLSTDALNAAQQQERALKHENPVSHERTDSELELSVRGTSDSRSQANNDSDDRVSSVSEAHAGPPKPQGNHGRSSSGRRNRGLGHTDSDARPRNRRDSTPNDNFGSGIF